MHHKKVIKKLLLLYAVYRVIQVGRSQKTRKRREFQEHPLFKKRTSVKEGKQCKVQLNQKVRHHVRQHNHLAIDYRPIQGKSCAASEHSIS